MELNGGTIIIFPCGFLYEKRGVIYAMKSLKIVQIAKSLKCSQCVAMCILFFKKSWNQFFLMKFFEVLSEVKGRCWEYIAYRMKSYRDNEDWQSILRVFI